MVVNFFLKKSAQLELYIALKALARLNLVIFALSYFGAKLNISVWKHER